MGFLKWLLGTVIVDPLIMLGVWNVIVVPMFQAGSTTFVVCFWISVVINSIYGLYKLSNHESDRGYF